MNRHLRKAVVVTAAITAGLLMTACQNDSASTGGSSTSSSASSSKAGSQSKSQSGGSGTSAGNKGSGTVANNASSSKSGVSGTFENGTVSYLAPGKYIVAVPGRTQQAFFVAEDTVVNGAGTICGTQGSAETRCTLDELEAAAKKGLTAKVELTDGIATTITEDH